MTVVASKYPTFEQALAAAVHLGTDLYVDAGTHKLTKTAKVPTFDHLRVWGDGNASKIVATFPTGDLLHFGDGKNERRNLLLQDLAILTSVPRSAGWAVRLDRCVRTTIDNVDVGTAENVHLHHGGIWFNGYDDSRVDDCNIYAAHKGILVNGQPDQGYGADLVIGGGTKIANHRRQDLADHQPGAVGIHLAGGQGGTYIDTCQVIYAGVGILIDTAIGAANREVFLNPGCVVDSCADDGIRVMANSVGTLQMTGLWSASHGRGGDGNAVRIDGAQHGTFHLTGCRLFNCKNGDGIAANGGITHMSGCVVDDNRIGVHRPNRDAFVQLHGCLVHRNGRDRVGL